MADDGGRKTDRRSGLAVGRVLGFPLFLNPSTLIFAALVTLTYGSFVDRTLDFSSATSYAIGLLFVVCLLTSVLLHELGHALTARQFRIGVRGITLELLGGYTEMDRDAPTPRVDLLVALAGPAVSLALGLVAVVAAVLLPGGTLVYQLAFQLAISNLLVAAFNALPGLPLDGGRALRAGVWAVTQDRHRGTEVAGWTGRVVAVLTAVAVALLTVAEVVSVFGLVFMLFIAATLWQGASQAIRLARISRRFPLIDLSRLARPVFSVPSGTPLAEAARRAAEAGRGDAALAVTDAAGELVALVHGSAADAVPAERRPWVPVDSVSRAVAGISTLSASLGGEEVIRAVQENPGAEYLVTSGQDVVGVLRVADLATLLEPKGK
ncbi:MAG TPA: site-2 protease family protein [Pilimelia sp.]|nr:site-2 protease family protein [Pilimelia sp.]